MSRIKLLVVISHLTQSGSERFTFELLKAIDRERFDVALLTKRRRWKRDYYDDLIEGLGVPIIRGLPIFLHYARRFARPLWLLLRWPIELAHRLIARFRLGDLLDRYDVICPVQIENYYLVQPLLRSNDRLLVFLMSNGFQYAVNPYLDCDPHRRYRFTIYDHALPGDWAEAPCRGAETIYFPLSMDLRKRPELSEVARIERPYRIAIFIRLTRERAFSGLFQAFRDVVAAEQDAELWVYGRGNPSIFDEELQQLGIKERVFFKGHVRSLEAELREVGLSCIWSTSYNTTLGYASIELASFGFPTLFWNIGTDTAEACAERSGGALQSFLEPAQLAAVTLAGLRDPEALRASGRSLREWVRATYDISRHIGALEQQFAVIASEHRRSVD